MNSDLLHRIESFELDDLGSDFKFSDRLARENSWTTDYAKRSIAEYKKFLFLAAEAGHPVTPSVEVDQVWHLHLCYTRSYWNDLCQDTLGFPLHHGPTKGGHKENEKFNNWYQKTLDSYQRILGTTPPIDIWPAPKLRFSPQDIKNIDCKKHFVIPKKTSYRVLVATALSFCALGCTTVIANRNEFPVGWFFITCALVIILSIIIGKGNSGGGGKGNGGGNNSSCGGCGSGCGGGCGGCGG